MTQNPKVIHETVTSDEATMRLDRWFRLKIPGLPQSMIEKSLRKGLIKVEGQKAKSSLRVEEGQRVSFPSSLTAMTSSEAPKPKLTLTKADERWLKEHILFEDGEILVFNKPPGLPVQGGTKQHKSLDLLARAYAQDYTPRLVHRLDLSTSGVLVMAKTMTVARWLTQAFKERQIEKLYWAIVCGVPSKSEGAIRLPLTKKQTKGGEKILVDRDEGVAATTYYRVLDEAGKRMAFLELTPKTGRTHQLRVHCAEGLKTPILGDGKYGGKEAFPLGRVPLHLHARSLRFDLPSKKGLCFIAPLPDYFESTCNELGFQCD